MVSMGLTTQTALALVPILMKTLKKHYTGSFSPEGASRDEEQGGSGQNDKQKLSYHQVFNIVKDFMSTTSEHTIEDLQEFANMRIPSQPSVTVLRVVVPMSCCDKAAEYLIDALGGESATKKIVGGTKWWQIRGVNGVDGEWIVAKKDWKEAQRRATFGDRKDKGKERKEKEKVSQESSTDPVEDPAESDYTQDMDGQRCILYLHGGGYYFGSVDQERYSIQRFARKINGRAFAINYRLSPQYPFPCAIQDALAAYLYLIQPPPEAKHKPVKPEHIVIMGDSAGGGLSLATLQVIRDSRLPQCAGGVLISPWCDLTHSFPSIHGNTETDVIPCYGLSVHKPSALWPPHPESADAGRGMGSGPSTSASSRNCEKVVVQKQDGQTLEVDSQIQFYTPNSLLSHPLISPCRAYLGGLPPLYFMAGDHEVLRDEIIYTAHRAANPSKYPIPDESKRLYPKITEFAAKYPTPTKVHLQVYDGCAHVLPILFPFTPSAKFCFRVIASFCRFATGMQPSSPEPSSQSRPRSPLLRHLTVFVTPSRKASGIEPLERAKTIADTARHPRETTSRPSLEHGNDGAKSSQSKIKAVKEQEGGRYAGDNPPIYNDSFVKTNFIRERVSINGLIRALEPEAKLSGLQLKDNIIGVICKLSLSRYIEGKAKRDDKFSGTLESIKSERPNTPFKKSPWYGPSTSEHDECPPPSSIVLRRDRWKAQELAKIADRRLDNTSSSGKAYLEWIRNVRVMFRSRNQ